MKLHRALGHERLERVRRSRNRAQAIQLAIDLGCNFFDTAWAYGDGKSDGLLGEALTKNKGKRIYAASKIPPKNLRWPASAKD